MRVICDGLDLSDAVLKVIKAISPRTSNPILEGIKLTASENTLTLLATDTELGIEMKINANVFESGETVVPGKFFSEFVKRLTGEQIEMELSEKNQLKLKYTDSEIEISCLPASEFPNVQKVDSAEYFELSQKDLKTLINRTLFAVAVDDSRPILKGCLLEIGETSVRAVAIDGNRLALCNKQTNSNNKVRNVIAPSRSLAEIAKMLTESDSLVKVFFQHNYLMAEIEGCKITSRLLEGDFINYKQIIPNQFSTTVTINKAQLENTLDRASLLARNERNNLVKFDIRDASLTITSNSELGNIKENINIDLKGNDLRIAFNARFFSEALRVVNNDFVKLNLTSSISPCIITPNEGDEFIFLILPLRMI